jgi:SAM-dependent methyltransferase
VGADIAPSNLRFAARMPHVRTAIVCDCLNPPFAEGSFDLLVSNNFLHHVSAKAETLARWGRIASVLVFSENTRYWASGWTRPFVLRHLGLRAAAARAESEIEESHFQDLARLSELDEIATRGRRVLSRETCFGERTFFIASVFSMFMRCTGPPTPAVVKRLLLGPLRSFALPLTRRLARNLIRYDATVPRDRDAYVLYVLASEEWSSTQGSVICPTCRGSIETGSCMSCGRSYTELDGMLFVLPDELAHIQRDYDVVASVSRAAEQL